MEYELQNVLALAFTCGVFLWATRLLLLLSDLYTMKNAVKKHHVRLLNDIQAYSSSFRSQKMNDSKRISCAFSLNILKEMTVQRIQQYLRTLDHVEAVEMNTIHVPFDVLGNTLHATIENEFVGLTFDIQAGNQSCSIQVYYDVDIDLFDEKHIHQENDKNKPLWTSFWTRNRQNSDEKAERKALNSLPSSSSPRNTLDDVVDSSNLSSYRMKTCPLTFEAATGAYRVKTYNLAPVFPVQEDARMIAVVFKAMASRVQIVVHNEETRDDPIVSATIFLHLSPNSTSPTILKRLFQTQSGRVHVAHELYGMADFIECSICLEDPTRVIILPCRHCCVCATCLNEIDSCPICRTKFSSYITMDTDSSTALAAILPTSSSIV
ncbi:hypothetical protein THRCLA_10736 [Thraustotheca clavata]|uniref:RING-type domain-containing protein n=1 Tax=Thraustotheca clavata TaxID=74557 RepID=A0A1V9YHK7_9STRA|nr:hypothetical protein THRCLA_10736 [Thraustotheca clavata]